MKRGEVWTMAGGPDYAGKPRPVVIIQDDSFAETRSVVICSFTTNSRDAPLFRIETQPSEGNGLISPSCVMVDKIAAVPRERLGRRIGKLEADDMLRVNRAMIVFLGLATSPRERDL